MKCDKVRSDESHDSDSDDDESHDYNCHDDDISVM